MKPSTAAFTLLLVLIAITALVVIVSMIYPNENNAETVKGFFGIMQYVITLVGGGYLGVQIGEKHSANEASK